jgi:hypothetical protein
LGLLFGRSSRLLSRFCLRLRLLFGLCLLGDFSELARLLAGRRTQLFGCPHRARGAYRGGRRNL